jgi:hypothetical protein
MKLQTSFTPSVTKLQCLVNFADKKNGVPIGPRVSFSPVC